MKQQLIHKYIVVKFLSCSLFLIIERNLFYSRSYFPSSKQRWMYSEPAWFVVVYRLSIQYISTHIFLSCTAFYIFFSVLLLFIGLNNCRKYCFHLRYHPPHRWDRSPVLQGRNSRQLPSLSLDVGFRCCSWRTFHTGAESSSCMFWSHACVRCCNIRAVCARVCVCIYLYIYIYKIVVLACLLFWPLLKPSVTYPSALAELSCKPPKSSQSAVPLES